MASIFMIFGLFSFFMISILSIIEHTWWVHNRYVLDHALKKSILNAYQGQSIQEVSELFNEFFLKLSPEHLEYTIILKNFELKPKLVQFKIIAIDEMDRVITLEETLVEEAKDVIGS